MPLCPLDHLTLVVTGMDRRAGDDGVVALGHGLGAHGREGHGGTVGAQGVHDAAGDLGRVAAGNAADRVDGAQGC
jgi:hypothetical protein